jgi:hypothetical protein
MRVIGDAARRMLRLLAEGFAQTANALAERDRVRADAALTHFFASRESLDALVAGIKAARSLSRWSLRGRLASGGVAEIARRYDRRGIRLFASTLFFAETLARALRNGHEPPPWLPSRVDMVASACAALADGAPARFGLTGPAPNRLTHRSGRGCLFFSYAAAGCGVVYEGPDDVHVVDRNASGTNPAKFLVFLIKDKGAPALVPVE